MPRCGCSPTSASSSPTAPLATAAILRHLIALEERPWADDALAKSSRRSARSLATRMAANLDYDDWLNFLGNKHMVTVLLSRLRHQRTTIRIDGPSLREPRG